MTALRPHPLHKESLLILLGLAPLPENVQKLFEKQEVFIEKKRLYDLYDSKEKEILFAHIVRIIESGTYYESDIISCLEADEESNGKKIFPTGKKFGNRPPKETLVNWIREAKRTNNLQRSKFCDEVVPLALSGKSITDAVRIVGCTRATALNVYNALGLGAKRKKEFKKLKPSFIRRINALADKLKHEELNNGISK